jgi:hypothetical protein
MSYKSNAAEVLRKREERHQAYLAAPAIADRYPKAGDFAIELTFRDPAGLERPTPRRRLFMPSMRAIFEVPCPVHGCEGGGFDLGKAVGTMLSDRRSPRTGQAHCEGVRSRRTCGLELNFRLTDTAEG